MTGAHTRKDGKAAVGATLENVHTCFPRLKTWRTLQAAYSRAASSRCARLAAR